MDETTPEQKNSEAAQPACEEGKKGTSRLSLCGGMAKAAKFTGKAARTFHNTLDATGSFLAAPVRERESSLSARASKLIRRAQKRVAELERQMDKMKSRLGDRLASNVLKGIANPADESEAQDITKGLEATSVKVGEVEEVLESLDKMVTLLGERLESLEKKRKLETPEERPGEGAEEGAQSDGGDVQG